MFTNLFEVFSLAAVHFIITMPICLVASRKKTLRDLAAFLAGWVPIVLIWVDLAFTAATCNFFGFGHGVTPWLIGNLPAAAALAFIARRRIAAV